MIYLLIAWIVCGLIAAWIAYVAEMKEFYNTKPSDVLGMCLIAFLMGIIGLLITVTWYSDSVMLFKIFDKKPRK